MRRFFSVFTTVAVLAWLLPLGAFIKPAQEKTACGGQRAFHMCSMMQPPAKVAPGGIAFTDPGSPERAPKSQGSGGDDLLAPDREIIFRHSSHTFAEAFWLVPSEPFLHPSVPIPKL